MTGRPLRALIVEDNERDAALLIRELRRGGYDLAHERVETETAMRRALAAGGWDIVLSDYSLPNFDAPSALAVLNSMGIDLPFIILSGTIGEEIAVDAMRAGAHDFMAKGKFARLLPAIERELHDAAKRGRLRAVEAQLRQAQKMEALGQLTGGIAHDFNNLLGVIVADGELLLDRVRADAGAAELVNDLLANAFRGAELTKRLLAVARQQPMSPQLVDLNARLPEIVAMLRRTLGEGIAVESVPAAGLWPVRVDASQVQDSLLNLAINARDAMPAGGTLTIATGNLPAEAADAVPGLGRGAFVSLSVIDTGTGMSAEVIERATEPFFTTKEAGRGTGLGLSMVYGFATQSGGHLEISSKVGEGTKVTLYLPRAEATGAEAAAATGSFVPADGNGSILVVDDNAALLRVTVRQLVRLGFSVRSAESGPAALALFDAGERFDLLFTDIGLPDGMSGFDLAEAARTRQPGLKIVFCTGYAKPGPDGREALGPILYKPYRSQELAAVLGRVLERQG